MRRTGAICMEGLVWPVVPVSRPVVPVSKPASASRERDQRNHQLSLMRPYVPERLGPAVAVPG